MLLGGQSYAFTKRVRSVCRKPLISAFFIVAISRFQHRLTRQKKLVNQHSAHENIRGNFQSLAPNNLPHYYIYAAD